MTAILQTYYVYDPGVSDELGGLRVQTNDKGKFVLATPQMIQYWVDQGLLGDKPLGEISGEGRVVLDQITRGRTKDPDTAPKRVPRYSKAAQSGAVQFAGQPKAKKKAQPKRAVAEKKPRTSA